jgi:hypothetical protein
MGRARTPPFHINPSTIARYFFHDCERFLYYSSASSEQRKRQGIPVPEFDQSPLVEAILQSGHRWEQEVLDTYLRGRVVIAGGTGELHTRRIPPQQTLRYLRTEPPGRCLYQPTLVPPRSFYETYEINPRLITISDNHPDLVEVLPSPDGGRLLRVVDLKRGEALRLTHRVQVLFYALELQALLESEGIGDTRVDLDHGAVWLGKQPAPVAFRLSDFRPHLERFLRSDLPRILGLAARDAHWHLYDRCEWCEFFEHCRTEMRDTDDVSRLVQLTTFGKRHLRDEAGVKTLTELGSFLRRADADEVLDRCASLAGQRHRLAVRALALQSEQPQLHGAYSPDLPQGENIGIFLTLQREPLGQHIYLAGVHVTAREDLRARLFSDEARKEMAGEDGRLRPVVWLAHRPEDVATVRRRLVLLLDDLLRRTHDYNQKHTAWKEQLSLQAYVQTEQERSLLFAALLEALEEPDLAERAMTLLFHFQGPELLQADRHPKSEVAYPVVVLQAAISRLLALPVEVSYTLPEMLDALGSTFRYTRRDYYHFPLGHGLRAEALHAAWYRGKTENLAEIEQQCRTYLQAVAALLRAVREQAKSHLFAWPPKFTLPGGAGIRDPLLSRLAFFARYESLLRCLAVREARTEARLTQVLLGQVIELEAAGDNQMDVVGELFTEPEPGGFPAWLLVRDNDEGRRAQVEYADYWYRNNPRGGPDSPHRAIVGIAGVSTVGKRTRLQLTYARPLQGTTPRQGERFLLYQRFTDFTTDAVVKFLEELDGEKGSARFFTTLLRDPESAAVPMPLPSRIRTAACQLEAHLNFTPSQREALRAICEQKVTAVWGPPGTGKTHFLAGAIIALAQAHARAGKPLRVLVTAFTHAAIENLLQKTVAACPAGDRVAIAKAKYWQGSPADIEVVDEADMGDWLDQMEVAVLGATAYSCLKQRNELPPFDLVVIDEASQVRVPEAAVAASLAAGGRLVLAGDHLQLPPIVAGTYPPTAPGEPLLHRSIFEAIVPRTEPGALPQGIILRQLLENFRMNDVLTGYAARLLYGPRYVCCNAAVAAQRLAFRPPKTLEEVLAFCLDPAWPLVVVLLDGIRAMRASPVEAELAAQLVVALREGLRDSRGKLYTDDAAFFRRGVFVVSPHHAQIRAIQSELARLRNWQGPPFVDTVDKMQGQEADAVIVSYGVADPEFALREAEFIYGLNRLNVAVTRARCKTIVCLPRALLDASPQVLDVEAAAAGLGFMRRLVAEVEQFGEVLELEGEGGVEARIVRTCRPPE